MKLESKTGKIPFSDEHIYNFLTNFNNFTKLIPTDKVKGWQSDETSCRFTVDLIGEIGVKIIEKEPYKLIKLGAAENSKYNFSFWIQLKKLAENETAIKCTLEADLNPMIQMVAKKPIQEFLDKLIDRLTTFSFN